ncbi:MAG: autotransporter-associated beta strand repeat-containing protein [Pyrinomonadaceae bacterium]|nr:autotransporter-associated beta strand repeat-containing protein [Pyrinomonadaceae bacterium]
MAGALGASVHFHFSSSAANANLSANSGSVEGGGGTILFENGSFGGTARVQLYGFGNMDISTHDAGSVTIGSLEGDGKALLGARNLTIGSNNLSTVFSGAIQDGGLSGEPGGSISKTGLGTVTLDGANSYTGGTTVEDGTLVVSNSAGSGTGTGPVQVDSGTLGGSGIIAGGVTVGTAGGPAAFLAPAHATNKQATLTIQGALTFNSVSTYTYTFKAKKKLSKADKVIANGVTINSGANFVLSGITQGRLTQGLVLTVIRNTAQTPIVGTFSNLPDGAIMNVNGNNLQASYEGGDGNDLTLTVVP